jgi:hypothetical protein
MSIRSDPGDEPKALQHNTVDDFETDDFETASPSLLAR